MNREVLKKVIYCGLFLIPFVPFLVSGSLFFPFITTKAFAWRIIVEIIFAAWVLLAAIAPEFRLRRSPILYAFLAFLVIVGLADAFGLAPVKSFWSNFERMEGYITMLHLGALFIVMASFFREREWKWWWNTSLAASALMVIYCLFQLLGAAEIHQGGARVDGTLGNAAYLALYLLIHIFVALYYMVKSKGSGLRWIYIALIIAETAILYFTATRGAILGLLGGLVVIGVLNITNRENIKARKWSIYLLGILVALGAGFFLARGTNFVKKSPVLARFANISLSEWKSEGRSFVWSMALKGVKEKPILGWGQDNFNYIFAEHYSAQMFNLEPWFDRAHNIFLDWGVSAGVLGLGAYLSLYVVLLLAIWKRDSAMSRFEKSILTGLIAAYFFNNFFVFDNLVSYTLFVALLAYMHSRIAKAELPAHGLASANSREAPLLLVGTIVALSLVLYFVNIKPIIANATLIDALKSAQSPAGQRSPAIAAFERAYNESRLGRPEVVEWISSSAPAILSDETIPIEQRNAYFNFATGAIEGMTKTLKDDPRYELLAGSYYTSVGAWDLAVSHLKHALALMPQKQQIYWNLGQALYYKKDYAGAIEAFREAYQLAPNYEQAKALYQAALKEIPH